MKNRIISIGAIVCTVIALFTFSVSAGNDIVYHDDFNYREVLGRNIR